MALSSELMAKGLPHGVAFSLGQDALADSLTATGTTQADAYALTSSASRFSTVNSGTGALLPAAVGRPIHAVFNNGSNALLVYPTGSEKVNNGSSFSVASAKAAFFIPLGQGWLAVVSA